LIMRLEHRYGLLKQFPPIHDGDNDWVKSSDINLDSNTIVALTSIRAITVSRIQHENPNCDCEAL